MKNFTLRQLLNIIFAVVISTFFLKIFFVDVFEVKGDSMSPSILKGDYVFVNRMSHYLKNFNREDIIVARSKNQGKIVKRIIGLPEERIEIADGYIWIKNDRRDSGRILKENYLNLPATPSVSFDFMQLDPKEYFVLGDNRYSSVDSRELGPVNEWDIEGRVFLIFRPNSFSFKIF